MFKQAWDRCRSNLKANLITGVCIWVVGGVLIFFYYKVEYFASWLDQFGKLKKDTGFLYSALSTSLFGGLIPYLALLFRKSIPKTKRWAWLVFFVLFWGVKGMEVDAFYRIQGYLFGQDNSWEVIFSKVCTDQFIYCVFWSAPITAIFYGWKNADFLWSEVKEIRDLRCLVRESAFLLFSTWIIWIPAVAIIYAMPTDLQIPCFNLTLCFFVLVISYLEPHEEVAG
ncbi:MAG: hypothetical protein VW576_01140 [Opitutae bacterium]